MSYTCCYCGKACRGEAWYCIPEGFPRDKDHEGKPLCRKCGGYSSPTLDAICRKLDLEKKRSEKACE